jgi:hypothetical protein
MIVQAAFRAVLQEKLEDCISSRIGFAPAIRCVWQDGCEMICRGCLAAQDRRRESAQQARKNKESPWPAPVMAPWLRGSCTAPCTLAALALPARPMTNYWPRLPSHHSLAATPQPPRPNHHASSTTPQSSLFHHEPLPIRNLQANPFRPNPTHLIRTWTPSPRVRHSDRV